VCTSSEFLVRESSKRLKLCLQAYIRELSIIENAPLRLQQLETRTFKSSFRNPISAYLQFILNTLYYILNIQALLDLSKIFAPRFRPSREIWNNSRVMQRSQKWLVACTVQFGIFESSHNQHNENSLRYKDRSHIRYNSGL